jgi:uncharacterized protein (UPF0264 family)
MAVLLVSVRSLPEARAALAAGAALIDVKEPAHGSLGRALDETIAAVLGGVAGRRPVSAALGELVENPAPYEGRGLAYAKWGLADCAKFAGWRQRLDNAADRLAQADSGCRPVAVAYADWRRAAAPCPEAVAAFAFEHRFETLLIDTCHKDGTTLLDWLPVTEVRRLCHACQACGVRVALAGSLGFAEIQALREAEPDWFAVRGAVCRGGRRIATIDPAKVRRLVNLLTGAATRCAD